MKKIFRKKGGGKTMELIKMSAETQNYIVCKSMRESERILSISQEKNLNIPMPITYREFVTGGYYAKGIKGFLIDNVEDFIQYLAIPPVNAITLTVDENGIS